MGPAPRIVWVWVGLQLLEWVLWPLVWPPPSLGFYAVGSVVMLVVLFWFVRGVRAVWWLLVIAFAFSLIPFGPPDARFWVGAAFTVASLGLLITPQMRRYFFDREPVAES
jgi:hypothetical protein